MTTQVYQDAITQAIAAAQTAAAAATAGSTSVMTTQTQTQAPVALGAGHVRTLDDALATASNAVDVYFKNGPHGYVVDTAMIPQVRGTINLAELRFPYSVRFNVGGATKFARSYDGIREAQSGRPWAEIVQQAQAMDPKCRGQYDAVEVSLVLTEELKVGAKVYPVGARAGITTPVTGYRPVMQWVREVQASYGSDAVVEVMASIETKVNPGQTPHGLPKFTVVQ